MKAIWKGTIVSTVIIIVTFAAIMGFTKGRGWLRTRALDRDYAESFPHPSEIAPELKNRRIVFHIKTGLVVDDAQICEGFNVALVALEAGADVTIVFSGSAALDFLGSPSRLESTKVPERLRKLIAYQSHVHLQEVPYNYKDYLEMIHERGADMVINTGFNIVLGKSEKLLNANPGFEYIRPVTYAELARVITETQSYISY